MAEFQDLFACEQRLHDPVHSRGFERVFRTQASFQRGDHHEHPDRNPPRGRRSGRARPHATARCEESLVRPLLSESGGHRRWQRVPPTERHGRVHTSTTTVATFEHIAPAEFRLKDAEIDVRTARGSGPGGQHRNKTDSCVVMTHKPTGIQVRIDSERSQHENRRIARTILDGRVRQERESAVETALAASRRGQNRVRHARRQAPHVPVAGRPGTGPPQRT